MLCVVYRAFVEHIPGGAPLLAVRDRAIAAVVHAYGRGLLDEASCAELLDEIQAAPDVDAVDSAVRRLAQCTALRSANVVDLARARRIPADRSPVAVPEPDERPTSAAPPQAAIVPGVFDGPPPGTVGLDAWWPAPQLPPELGVVGPAAVRRDRAITGSRRLDAVDLALAARAVQGQRASRKDPRLVSLALVVAVLIALLVLGIVLVGAVHGAVPSGPARSGAPVGTNGAVASGV